MDAHALILELQRQGFELAAADDRIRVRPASSLPENLRQAILTHKAEILAELREHPVNPADLQARLDTMTADPKWVTRWTERLRTAQYATLDDVKQTLLNMMELAAERHRVGDAGGFRSWCKFILDHARGRNWDDAASRQCVGTGHAF